MRTVKVNIFLSHAPEDKPEAEKLMEWLYPMRDEVNVWYYNPPKRPDELPLSWRLLLPWYRPVDPRILYAETGKKRRENAHIYIFLTSYKSLKNIQVEEDITLSVRRRIECEWRPLAPLVLPLLISPSRWEEESRLAQFKPLAGGIPLNTFPIPEDGYLMATEQIAALVKVIQVRLHEAQHHQYLGGDALPVSLNYPAFSRPYLGEDPRQFDFQSPRPFLPPDWMGWSLIALIFTLSMGVLKKQDSVVADLHLKSKPAKTYEIEYLRKIPMMPLPSQEEIILPPVE